LLHSFGYDHEISKEEEIKMFDLQKKILNKLKIWK
jgi:ssRNA-specific RNase YbeY (16S rRNA maturation enzyme)